jgi:hypothetical protein
MDSQRVSDRRQLGAVVVVCGIAASDISVSVSAIDVLASARASLRPGISSSFRTTLLV